MYKKNYNNNNKAVALNFGVGYRSSTIRPGHIFFSPFYAI